MRLSHVSCGVVDLDEAEGTLRRELGLGLWRFPRGLGGHVPLAAHQYIELYTPEHPVFRPGWVAWSIAVADVGPWVEALGLDDMKTFGVDPERRFSPWHGRLAATTLSRASGGVVPYLTEYDASVDLDAVFAEKHRLAAHDVDVGAVSAIITDGRRITEVRVDVAGSPTAIPLDSR